MVNNGMQSNVDQVFVCAIKKVLRLDAVKSQETIAAKLCEVPEGNVTMMIDWPDPLRSYIAFFEVLIIKLQFMRKKYWQFVEMCDAAHCLFVLHTNCALVARCIMIT